MAICPACQQNMRSPVARQGCIPRAGIFWGAETHSRDEWGGVKEPCPDCGVRVGALHHPGCDMEQCRICGVQRLMCGCDEELGTERVQ